MDNIIKWVSVIAAIIGIVIALEDLEPRWLWFILLVGILGFICEQLLKSGKKPKKILFIDDEYKDFAIIDSLKKNNYDVCAVADITNIHDEKIKKAKIIFIDYKGVGKSFGSKQGIDLMKALKGKYPKKKIILFSAHQGFGMDADFTIADDLISKNAPLKKFMDIIDKYL